MADMLECDNHGCTSEELVAAIPETKQRLYALTRALGWVALEGTWFVYCSEKCKRQHGLRVDDQEGKLIFE